MIPFDQKALVAYPDGMPQPLRNGYNFTYEQNTVSTMMQNGWSRKRKLTAYPFRRATLQFQMSATDFQGWHVFVHLHAFQWMTMELQTDRTGPQVLSPEVVRFTSGVSYSYIDWNTITASVQVEIEGDEVISVPVSSPVYEHENGGGEDHTSGGTGQPDVPNSVDLNANSGAISYTFSGDKSIPFKTRPGSHVNGTIIATVTSNGAVRVWISKKPNGPAVPGYYIAATGRVVFSWYQGGSTPGLLGNSTYYLCMKAIFRKTVSVEFTS